MTNNINYKILKENILYILNKEENAEKIINILFFRIFMNNQKKLKYLLNDTEIIKSISNILGERFMDCLRKKYK